MDDLTLEKKLKVLADKTRLHIIRLIFQGEQCGCDLILNLNITQPTLSYHLKILSDAKLITGIKDKNRMLWTIHQEAFDSIHQALDQLFDGQKTC